MVIGGSTMCPWYSWQYEMKLFTAVIKQLRISLAQSVELKFWLMAGAVFFISLISSPRIYSEGFMFSQEVFHCLRCGSITLLRPPNEQKTPVVIKFLYRFGSNSPT